MAPNLVPFDGGLYLIKQFYSLPESDLLFAQLKADLAWQEESIFIYGRWVKVLVRRPRCLVSVFRR
jgi:hypothetical protein